MGPVPLNGRHRAGTACVWLALLLLTAATQGIEDQLDAAYELILHSKFEAARAVLIPLDQAHPRSGRTAFMLGLSYHQQRRYRPALPYFRRAVELDPDYYQTQHFLGYCLYYLGDGSGARKAFETFLEHSPDSPHTHFALGLVAYDDDRLEEARSRFVRAIELCGANPGLRQRRASAHARLADIDIRTGRLEAARRQLKLAIRLNPALYGAYFKLSRVLTSLGEHEAARRAYERFLHVRESARAAGATAG